VQVYGSWCLQDAKNLAQKSWSHQFIQPCSLLDRHERSNLKLLILKAAKQCNNMVVHAVYKMSKISPRRVGLISPSNHAEYSTDMEDLTPVHPTMQNIRRWITICVAYSDKDKKRSSSFCEVLVFLVKWRLLKNAELFIQTWKLWVMDGRFTINVSSA